MALLHFGLPNPFRPLLLVRLGAATAAVALAGFALLAPVGAHSSAPPGNNGTVKVDGEEFDKLHDNDPHVSCTFWIQWYGFDEGTQTSSVTFQAWPPTGNGETLMDDEVSFSGHGSGNTLDFQKAYDLTAALATYTPHPKQGFHVKLTIHTTGSIGADAKHKVGARHNRRLDAHASDGRRRLHAHPSGRWCRWSRWNAHPSGRWCRWSR